jgi:dolichol-phosphate mannosyltransferase
LSRTSIYSFDGQSDLDGDGPNAEFFPASNHSGKIHPHSQTRFAPYTLNEMSATMIASPTMPVGATVAPPAPLSPGAGRRLEKLAIVIPTLCEAENIGGLLNHVRAVLEPLKIWYEILVVDDDSCDGTAAVVASIAAKDSRVRLLIRKGERGLSGAILHGWQRTDASVLAVMDADLQHPPELLPQLISAMEEGHDLVIGSRYTPGGDLGHWNPMRKMLSAAAVWVTLPLQRRALRASDPMSGFFMVRRRCLPRAELQKSGFKLLLEILVKGRFESIEEVPFAFGLRYRGASKANFRVAWDYGRLLARLYAGKLGFRAQA